MNVKHITRIGADRAQTLLIDPLCAMQLTDVLLFLKLRNSDFVRSILVETPALIIIS